MKVAFFLPQYHSDPLNDEFWGPGFTEWVNVKKARPQFRGHSQPKVPVDGHYSLDDESVISERLHYYATLGIDSLAIYTYWFSPDRQALGGPLRMIDKQSNLPLNFFIAWVNSDWTKSWVGKDKEIIAEQSYNNLTEMIVGWREIIKNKHYQKINGRPVFYIHNPSAVGLNFADFVRELKKLLATNNLGDPYLIAPYAHCDDIAFGLIDRYVGYPPGDVPLLRYVLSGLNQLQNFLPKKPFLKVIPYSLFWLLWLGGTVTRVVLDSRYIPTFLTGWDNTPRYGERGFVIGKMRFGVRIQSWIIKILERKSKLFFVKAANEWAEGNTVEAEVGGNKYVNVIKNSRI